MGITAHTLSPADTAGPSAVPHTPMDDLCLDFVNSRFNDHRGSGAVYDRLAMPGWWSWLVQRWELGPCRAPGAADLGELRALRSRARRLLEAGDMPPARDRTALDRVLGGAPLGWHVSRDPDTIDVELRPLAAGVPHVAASVVVSLVEVLAHDRFRVRQCANPHCSFLFRDTSRGSSRRWCDPAICGNLVKVRAFRAGRKWGNP